MNLAALVLSSLSLLTVLVIGLRSIRLGERSATAAERSATASVKAAEATQRSVTASRIDAALEVVLAMREMFNVQKRANGYLAGLPYETGWVPAVGTPEATDRTALCHRLEARLVLLEDQLGSNSNAWALTTTYLWNSTQLDRAVDEAKALLKATGSFS